MLTALLLLPSLSLSWALALQSAMPLQPSRHGARYLMMSSADEGIEAYAAAITAAAAKQVPFTAGEVASAIKSMANLVGEQPWSPAYGQWVSSNAHIPHKDWARTERSAASLAKLVGPATTNFRSIFEVVLGDGGWDAAAATASRRGADNKPWAVLVTGVNGIRKTTSVYQPWFREALAAALGEQFRGEMSSLPAGDDSYFRQLDYMMATMANEEFRALYELDNIATYSQLKSAIFARYRTIAEAVGVMLVKEAREKGLNVMVETSGRDIAMFQYLDTFFPDSEYNKLVVHFTVNNIEHAEASVDMRMTQEMATGHEALISAAPAITLVRANMGGPYGSAGGVLRGVQGDAQAVWERVAAGGKDAPGRSWFKAPIAIEASAGNEGWVASTGGKRFDFVPPS